jgi:hypothetical protein
MPLLDGLQLRRRQAATLPRHLGPHFAATDRMMTVPFPSGDKGTLARSIAAPINACNVRMRQLTGRST